MSYLAHKPLDQGVMFQYFKPSLLIIYTYSSFLLNS